MMSLLPMTSLSITSNDVFCNDYLLKGQKNILPILTIVQKSGRDASPPIKARGKVSGTEMIKYTG